MASAEERLAYLEERISFIDNFLHLLVSADKSLRDQLTSQKKENIRHGSKTKRVLIKSVEAGADMEERIDRIERQVSLLFQRIDVLEVLSKGRDKLKIRLKT